MLALLLKTALFVVLVGVRVEVIAVFNYEINIANMTEAQDGMVTITWSAEGLEHMEFSVLYGLTGGDGTEKEAGGRSGEEAPVEWLTLDNVACCTVTLNHLRGRSLYTFKVAATFGNGYLESAPVERYIRRGRPREPRHISVDITKENDGVDNTTHVVVIRVAWMQPGDASHVLYYNVTLCRGHGHMDNISSQQDSWWLIQTREPQATFRISAADTTSKPDNTTSAIFDVTVVAVSASGTSDAVHHHHYQAETGSTSGMEGGDGGVSTHSNLFWVILAPVVAVMFMPLLIATTIYINRRSRWRSVGGRRSHAAALLSGKDDNSVSYMPLQLHVTTAENGSTTRGRQGEDRLEVRLSRLLAAVGGDGTTLPAAAIGSSSPRSLSSRSTAVTTTSTPVFPVASSLQETRRGEVNRIGRPCETSPHKAQLQLVSDGSSFPDLGRPANHHGASSSATSSSARSASFSSLQLMMSTPTASPRSSKRTPIIPLSEEKLLPRVNIDLSRYSSYGRESSSQLS